MDRNLGAFKRLVQHFVGNEIVGPRVDYLASYPATAVTQNGDGTLEIQPDDSRLPSLSSVPIRYGVPGVSAQIANGGRVLLAFAGGDPAKPIATVWEAASITALFLGGPGGTQGSGLGANIRAELDALWTAVLALAGGGQPVDVTHAVTLAATPAILKQAQTVASSIVKVTP